MGLVRKDRTSTATPQDRLALSSLVECHTESWCEEYVDHSSLYCSALSCDVWVSWRSMMSALIFIKCLNTLFLFDLSPRPLQLRDTILRGAMVSEGEVCCCIWCIILVGFHHSCDLVIVKSEEANESLRFCCICYRFVLIPLPKLSDLRRKSKCFWPFS